MESRLTRLLFWLSVRLPLSSWRRWCFKMGQRRQHNEMWGLVQDIHDPQRDLNRAWEEQNYEHTNLMWAMTRFDGPDDPTLDDIVRFAYEKHGGAPNRRIVLLGTTEQQRETLDMIERLLENPPESGPIKEMAGRLGIEPTKP